MKATAPRNRPGRYKAFIPGPLSVYPTLAWKMKIKTEPRKGSIGRKSKKIARSEDSRIGVNKPRKALEKIGVRKGATKSKAEAAAPTISVFHAYLRVYSMDETFE